jgi:PAS domain S-box-containing protein
MRLTLRTQSNFLVIPLAIALAALLVIALMPYFAVDRDIQGADEDLQATAAILDFTQGVIEQSRECADLLVTGSEGDLQEIRHGAAIARGALSVWRAVPKNFQGEPALIQRIERELPKLAAASERLIALTRQGRHTEATALMRGEIHERSATILRLSDSALRNHRQDIGRHVTKIAGGIKYSGFLSAGTLESRIDELDSHTAKVVESAALRNAVEAESWAYWRSYLTPDHSVAGEIAVYRDHADEAFEAWRSAIASSSAATSRAGRTADLQMIDELRGDYLRLRFHGGELQRLVEQRSDAAAKALLIGSMEIEHTPGSAELEAYIDRESDMARGNLVSLRSEVVRVRRIVGVTGIVVLLAGLCIPWFIARGMITPIRNLRLAAERIGQGDFETRVAVPSLQELAALATTFNDMTAELLSSREQLRSSEERFQLASKATSDMIFDFDVQTRVFWVSEEFRERCGLGSQEHIPFTYFIEQIHPDDHDRITTYIAELLDSTFTLGTNEYRFLQLDGTFGHFNERVFIVRDADHRPVRVIGALVDVTERKIAGQAIAALSRQNKMILDSVGEGILGIDRNGVIISGNPAAASMLGRSSDDLAGHRLEQYIVPPPDGHDSKDCPVQATLRDGTRQTSDEYLFSRADGSTFPADFTCNSMLDETGAIIGAVVTFRDITQKFEVDRLKSQFVSTVSHELRTPLTSIRGSLGLLNSGLLGPVSEKGQRMLEIAVSNTDRLVRLINDILDLERMSSGAITLEKQTIDVTELMQEAVDVIKPLADAAGVSILTSPFLGSIAADHDRMVQTLTNLLSNAVKFSPSGSTVSLSADSAGSTLRFRIADRGRGIPPGKLESIFERFQQVDASDSRDKGGTGLGLPICRSIVQQHGGRIWAESVFGQGSTFYFTMPFEESAAQPSEHAGAVLVCDDDPAVRKLLEGMLLGHGYKVLTTESGEAAVELARRHLPQAILLDPLMPGVSGWQTMAAMKEQKETSEIPILVVSVQPPAAAPGDHNAQIAGWIPKPLDEEHLFAALDRVTGHSRSAPRILIVEDDLDLAHVLRSLFEEAGVIVDHAANGLEAIEIASRVRPDLLVLDVVLPRMNGFNVIKWLRKDDDLRNIPVVVYSGADIAPADRPRLRLGPTEFFTKSRISPEEFEHTVLEMMNVMASRRAVQPAKMGNMG